MIQAAGPLFAGARARVGIKTELKAFAVHMIREGLHSFGESCGICDDGSRGITAHLPAVVDVHILVAGGLHATADHGVGHFTNEFVADVAAKLVPTIPSHRRSLRKRRGRLAGGCGCK